jgi:hypothetical protein
MRPPGGGPEGQRKEGGASALDYRYAGTRHGVTVGTFIPVHGFPDWMLDAGCWMLDAGCWMLDAGCWMRQDGEFYDRIVKWW